MKKSCWNKSWLSTVWTVLLVLLISCQCLHADNRIMIFLKNAPEPAIKGAIQDTITGADANTEQGQAYILGQLAMMDQQTPSYNSAKTLKNAIRSSLTQKLSGFLGIYAGYFDYSDKSGLLSFPLRHASPKLYIAITPNIALIKIKEMVSHREFIVNEQNPEQNPIKLYVCERKHENILKPGEKAPEQTAPAAAATPAGPTDPAQAANNPQEKPPAQRFYWDIKEAALPADKKINPLTVIILTKPKNIYVPLGQFLTTDSPHLVLPNFYVMGNAGNNEAILQAIDYGNSFEQITTEEKKASDNAFQKMITNI